MRVGSYEVLGEAGRGGRGVVLKARAPDGSLVAVKIIQGASDFQAVARFDRERRLLEELGSSEGFVPLLAFGNQSGNPYIVMPFIEGGTLRDRLDRGKLAFPDAVALSKRLASAMKAAHERGIVHRDLKPENVLFTTDGTPLIADLGLGKHFDKGRAGASQTILLSRAGQFRGTVGYMAPEQARDAMSAGPPADVFALGAMLHECLTGEPAFEGESPLEVLSKIGAAAYQRRKAAPAERWADAIVARALDPKPEKRYANAGELARALEAGPEGFEPPPRRLGFVALGAGAAVALVVAFAVGRAKGASHADVAGQLQAARSRGEPAKRLAAARRVVELARRDDPEERAARGEALEIEARLLLEGNDAAQALEAARAALALAPANEARQLLLGQAALRVGRPDEAFSALEKRLEEKAPPLDAFRAGALSHLARGRAAKAEELAALGIKLHGEDPALLLARGRALRALGRASDALAPLAAAQRLGEHDARAEMAAAAIEACYVDPCPDPAQLGTAFDRDPKAALSSQALALIDTLEREWPNARGHPDSTKVVCAAIDRCATALAKVRSVSGAAPDGFDGWVGRLQHFHAGMTGGNASSFPDASGALGVLVSYGRQYEALKAAYGFSARMSPRVRFAVRAAYGITRSLSLESSSVARPAFESSEERTETKGIELLDEALSEDVAAIAEAQKADRFLAELHRSALRVRAHALWHRVARDGSRPRSDLERAVKSAKEALEIPTSFQLIGDAPVNVALAPALLLLGRLDEAEATIDLIQRHNDKNDELSKSSHELVGENYLLSWPEVHELRGELALERGDWRRAAESFAQAAAKIDTRSAWIGLARAREKLGDAAGARAALARVATAREPYLNWLDR